MTAAHGVVALFDTAVILLHPVIHVVATAMAHLWTQRLPDRAWVGVVPVGRDLSRRVADDIQCFAVH